MLNCWQQQDLEEEFRGKFYERINRGEDPFQAVMLVIDQYNGEALAFLREKEAEWLREAYYFV